MAAACSSRGACEALASVALAGCSLLFDPSAYEHDDAAGLADAGTDAGTPDAGPPACDGTQACCSWLDCEADETRPYCAYDEAGASWSCAAECVDDLDCAGYFAGDTCLFDSGARVCGCRDDGDCTFPGSPYCLQPSFIDCVECRGDGDCTGGRACLDYVCT